MGILFLTTATAGEQNVPLMTKTFFKKADGEIGTIAYGKGYTFDAKMFDVGDLEELSVLLKAAEKWPTACAVRGELVDPEQTVGIQRLLHPGDKGQPPTLKDRPCPWLMIDFDKVPDPVGFESMQDRLDFLISLLPEFFWSASYHYQWSSSAGLRGWDTLSCHFWFWLEEPATSEALRQRTGHENWEGVDRSLLNPVQVHYTAAPCFDGVDDPLKEHRSGLVKQAKDTLYLPQYEVKSVDPPWFNTKRYGALAGDKFTIGLETRLAEIGPNYHEPINRVIGYYAAYAPDVDEYYIINRLMTRILEAPAGKNPKAGYLNQRYLNNSLRGAIRKFRK